MPCQELTIEPRKLDIDMAQLIYKRSQCVTRKRQQSLVILICQKVEQKLHIVHGTRCGQAELGHVTADRADQSGALRKEEQAHSVQHQGSLLPLSLDRNETHRWAGHSLTDRRRIR